MKQYKASVEYAKDLKASIEQYKSLSDYARALYSYDGRGMAALSNWPRSGYPLSILLSILQVLTGFLTQHKGEGSYQSKTLGHLSQGRNEGAFHSS